MDKRRGEESGHLTTSHSGGGIATVERNESRNTVTLAVGLKPPLVVVMFSVPVTNLEITVEDLVTNESSVIGNFTSDGGTPLQWIQFDKREPPRYPPPDNWSRTLRISATLNGAETVIRNEPGRPSELVIGENPDHYNPAGGGEAPTPYLARLVVEPRG